MNLNITFKDKPSKAIYGIIFFFLSMAGFMFHSGLFSVSVSCEQKNCTTEVTSLFNIVRYKKHIDAVTKVELTQHRTSKGGTAYNVYYSNTTEREKVWPMDSTFNKEAFTSVQLWLTSGMNGISVHEYKTYYNFALFLTVLILVFMYIFYKTDKNNKNNPASILISDRTSRFTDLGGRQKITATSNILSAQLADQEEILRQRFPKMYFFINKRQKPKFGIRINFTNDEPFYMSSYNMTLESVNDAVLQINKELNKKK